MNINGFTNDNLHIGDVRITNDLQVDGDLDIKGTTTISGDIEFKGDVKIEPPNCLSTDCINSATPATGIEINTEYKLPVVKGTANQVLTQVDAAGNCEFKDVSGGITGYFYRNLFTMTQNNTSYTFNPGSIRNLYNAGTGSTNLGSLDNFPINSTIKWYARGRLDTSSLLVGQVATGIFQLTINKNIVAPASPIEYKANIQTTSIGVVQANSMFAIDITITREATNSYRFNGYGQFSSGTNETFTMDWNDVLISPAVPYTTWAMDLGFYSTGVNPCIPTAEVITCDLIVDTSALLAAPPAPTSHTALTDLTLGDAGHTQFALLNGRSGGQVLSGGLTPLHDLKLRSHNIGLDNIIVKDLKTEFKKNIDMDNNSIVNLPTIDVGGGTLSIVNSGFPAVSLSGGMNFNNTGFIYQCPSVFAGAGNLDIGSDLGAINIQTGVFPARQTEITIAPNLINVNSAITNFLGNDIVMANGRIQDVSIIDDGATNFINMNASGDIEIKSTANNVRLSSDLDMSNNNIINVATINGVSASGGVFMGTSNSLFYNPSVDGAIEKSIMPTSIVGSLTVPANTFKISSYHLVLAGPFNSNNGDTLTIRLYGGATSTTILGVLVVPLNNSATSHFEIECDFNVRALGGAGVAEITTNFDFTYNQSGGGGAFVGERNTGINNITFDTTADNTLLVTAQYSSTNGANNMLTSNAVLTQTY